MSRPRVPTARSKGRNKATGLDGSFPQIIMLAIYDFHNHSNVLAEGPRSPRHSHPDCSEFNVSLHDEILERYGSAFSHLLPHYTKPILSKNGRALILTSDGILSLFSQFLMIQRGRFSSIQVVTARAAAGSLTFYPLW
jgi:hypothetical protein